MRRFVIPVAAFVVALTPSFASAQGASDGRPLQGYACMSLKITDEQAHDFNYHVSFYTAPSLSAHVAGYASSQVAVRQPAHIVGDFTEALFPTGAKVWIQSDLLRPYHSSLDPSARCVPTILVNGRVAFSYPHG